MERRSGGAPWITKIVVGPVDSCARSRAPSQMHGSRASASLAWAASCYRLGMCNLYSQRKPREELRGLIWSSRTVVMRFAAWPPRRGQKALWWSCRTQTAFTDVRYRVARATEGCTHTSLLGRRWRALQADAEHFQTPLVAPVAADGRARVGEQYGRPPPTMPGACGKAAQNCRRGQERGDPAHASGDCRRV